MKSRRPKAILLSDGRFGHQRIVLGIAKSLLAIQDIEICWLKIEEIGKPNRGFQRLKALLGFGLQNLSYKISNDNSDVLPKYPTLQSLEGETIGYVIGAGPRSAAPAIAIARAFQAKSIYFGNPKVPFIKEFDLLIRFAKIWWSGSPTVSHFRPNDIDPKPIEPIDLGHRPAASFLIGGNKHWNEKTGQDFWQIIKLLSQNYTVTAYNSRRTPNVVSDKMIESYNSAITTNPEISNDVKIVDCRTSGFNSNLDAYKSQIIIVTADSMSMISEAVSARRKVIVIIPEHYEIPKSDESEIQYFLKRDNLKVIKVKEAKTEIDNLSNLMTMSGNHIEILADKLKSKLEIYKSN